MATLCGMVAFGLIGCEEVPGARTDTVVAPINLEQVLLGEIRPVARPVDFQNSGFGAQSGLLGTTVATLDATKPGLWLKTPLVRQEQQGTIAFGAKRLNVTLPPIDGPTTAGSLLSLGAMKAIDAPLTGFPELTVFGI